MKEQKINFILALLPVCSLILSSTLYAETFGTNLPVKIEDCRRDPSFSSEKSPMARLMCESRVEMNRNFVSSFGFLDKEYEGTKEPPKNLPPRIYVIPPKEPMPVKTKKDMKGNSAKPTKVNAPKAIASGTENRAGRRNNSARKFYPGVKTINLSSNQKMEVLRTHEYVLRTPVGKHFLIIIQDAEKGAPTRIVGEGRGKGRICKIKIGRINLSRHPAEQIPSRCFYFNRRVGKISFASGCYQINYTNWKFYSKQFGLKSFSVKNQRIVALELVRQQRGGRAYAALLDGNLNKALRLGTQDWEISIDSTLGKGKVRKIDLVKHARTQKVLKKLAKEMNS